MRAQRLMSQIEKFEAVCLTVMGKLREVVEDARESIKQIVEKVEEKVIKVVTGFEAERTVNAMEVEGVIVKYKDRITEMEKNLEGY